MVSSLAIQCQDKKMQSTCARQRVCFIIATLGHGRGGHFWSLKATVEALAREIDCFVIDVGVSPSPVVESSSVRSYHVPFTGLNIWSAIGGISRVFTEERPDVINLFDGRIDFLARVASIRHRIPLVRTKCGGPPPTRFFPYTDKVIIYSVEDRNWFSRSKKFSRSVIELIPNRTTPFTCDSGRIADLRSRIHADKPVVLRIARFTEHYETSMVQGINLVRRLNQENKDCQLVIIGALQNQGVYEHIAALSNKNVHIFTEDRFTLDAKELIDIGDLVIGTGRGFMEAASRGKVLLTPLADGDLPVLVTEENFADIFASNFSPRNRVENYNEESNYREIRRVLVNRDRKQDLQEFARRLNTKHFDLYSALEQHKAVCCDLRYRTHLPLFDLVYGFCGMLRSFWPFARHLERFQMSDENPTYDTNTKLQK